MTTRSSNFSQLLAPGLRKVYFDRYKSYPMEHDKFCRVSSSERAYEIDYEMSMLGGAFPQKPEGTAIQYVDPLTGSTKQFNQIPFGLGFRITHEMYMDDLYGPMRKMSAGLAKCSHNEVEYQAAGILDDASAGTYYTCFDTYPLAYTAHKLLSGQATPPNLRGGMAATYSNRPPSYGSLGITTLQTALIRFAKTPDQDGVLCLIKPSILWFPEDLRFVVKELLGSEYKPWTANNEINPVKDEGLKPLCLHFLASTSMWGLIAAGDDNPIEFIWREKDIFDNSDDFDTGDAKFKAYHRHTQGVAEWRGFDLGST